MKINSIELQNFRQFVNEHIEFNSDSDKKVSVIYGRNYIGKTTLIKVDKKLILPFKSLFNLIKSI